MIAAMCIMSMKSINMEANDFVDLHIHSCASDGTWTPDQLVQKALEADLKLIAVTDHDCMDSVERVVKLAKLAGIHAVPGVEVCSTKEGLQFHILGYGVDVHNSVLRRITDHNNQLLLDKDVESIGILQREGWPVSVEEFNAYTYDRCRGGWGSLAYLIDKKLCTGVYDYFNRIFTAEHTLAFPTFASVSEVVDAIHGAGGVAVCAHAASGFHTKDVRRNLELLKEENLDGFECYHSGHDEVGTNLLLRYCQEHDLLITAGSDCHGSFVPGRRIGVPRVRYEQIRLREELIR